MRLTNPFSRPGADLAPHCWAQENKPGPVLLSLCPAPSYWHSQGRVITSLRKFCWRWSSDAPHSAAGRGWDKAKSQRLDPEGIPEKSHQQHPTSQSNLKSWMEMLRHRFLWPPGKQRCSNASQDRGNTTWQTPGIQQGCHPNSYHLHRGQSNKALKYSRLFSHHWGKLPKKNPAEHTEQENLSRFATMIEPCITYPLLTASSSFQGRFLQEKSEGSCLEKLN